LNIKKKHFTKDRGISMLYTGKIVKYLDNDAVVLLCKDDEVLIFIEDDYVKWVDKSFIDIIQ
ncbi:MAG TPA: hypothetical protein PLR73_13280, partial [Acetivibrio sp.]|nr:hypothetical protein [Acetivibrio sp.]